MSDQASRIQLEDFWRERLEEAAKPEEQAAFRSRQQLRASYFTTEAHVNLITAMEHLLTLNAQAHLQVSAESTLPQSTRQEVPAGIEDLSIGSDLATFATSATLLSAISNSLSALRVSDPDLPLSAEAIRRISDVFLALKTGFEPAS